MGGSEPQLLSRRARLDTASGPQGSRRKGPCGKIVRGRLCNNSFPRHGFHGKGHGTVAKRRLRSRAHQASGGAADQYFGET
jgi:hypothetical protein